MCIRDRFYFYLGIKQFMAGAGVMLIGALLVPKLKDLIPATLS